MDIFFHSILTLIESLRKSKGPSSIFNERNKIKISCGKGKKEKKTIEIEIIYKEKQKWVSERGMLNEMLGGAFYFQLLEFYYTDEQHFSQQMP
jgi:hypothetical protein